MYCTGKMGVVRRAVRSLGLLSVSDRPKYLWNTRINAMMETHRRIIMKPISRELRSIPSVGRPGITHTKNITGAHKKTNMTVIRMAQNFIYSPALPECKTCTEFCQQKTTFLYTSLRTSLDFFRHGNYNLFVHRNRRFCEQNLAMPYDNITLRSTIH